MNIKFVFFLFMICLLSCSKNILTTNISEEPKNNSNQPNSANAANITPTLLQTDSQIKLSVPKINDFSIQTFFRHSDVKDVKNSMLPPFQFGEISFFVASVKAKPGDFVTAIPLQIEHENLTLKIKKVEKIPFLDCDAEKTGLQIEFEKITDTKLLKIKAISARSEDQPFDFFVIYPAVKNAKKLKQTELTNKMLPETVELKQVVAAIDLNTDGEPDLLVSNYCCYDSSQCDCTSNYQKINSEWKYLGGSEPC